MDKLKYKPTKAQLALANRISQDTYGEKGCIVPLTRCGEFCAFPMLNWPGFWSDKPADELVWMAVAARVNDVIRLDHSWSLGFCRPPHEPWGFVSEPYTTSVKSLEQDVQQVSDLLESWAIRVAAYPASEAAWNAPHCTPIAVTFMKDCWPETIRQAFRWLADHA